MINKQNIPAVLAGSGFSILLLGIFLSWYGFPKIVDMKIKQEIALTKGSDTFKMWEKFPFPFKFKVYIFNVENPDDVQNGANPIVREVGPYIYDQWRRKEKIVVDEATDTISYILKKHFVFNEEESGCRTQDDEVAVLNAALVGTALTVQSMFPSALGTISDAVPHLFPGIKNIFQKVKVRDLLFNGLLLDCSSPEIDFVCTAIKGTAPETVRQHENKRDFLFSMFHHLNDTEEGPYVIGRGLKNTTRCDIYSYKDHTELDDTWRSPECNMINGTDSTMYAQLGDPPPPRIYAFSSDLCRSVYLEFDKKTTTLGIPTYRYHLTERVFDLLEENDCYCPTGKDANFNTQLQCPPKGTMNLMPCMQAPTIYSNPHFYLGDRQLLSFVTGLKPEKEKHEMFAEIEPLTGTPVHGMKRAQFNLNLKKLEDFEMLSNVSEGLMPILWLEEGALVPKDVQEKLSSAYTSISTVEAIQWVIISLGLVLLAVSVILFFRKDKVLCFSDSRVAHFNEPPRHRREDKPTLSNSDNNFNSTLMYPSLYPQLVNRNVNIGMKKLNDDRFLM